MNSGGSKNSHTTRTGLDCAHAHTPMNYYAVN